MSKHPPQLSKEHITRSICDNKTKLEFLQAEATPSTRTMSQNTVVLQISKGIGRFENPSMQDIPASLKAIVFCVSPMGQ